MAAKRRCGRELALAPTARGGPGAEKASPSPVRFANHLSPIARMGERNRGVEQRQQAAVRAAQVLRKRSAMTLLSLDHVQLAMPAGREGEARAFYAGVLGLIEREKPANLATRGGCWFELGSVKVHLGVDREFRPAARARPAFLVSDVQERAGKVEAAGYQVVEDEPLDGSNRLCVYDPFGNRIELMQRVAS
jgi:catechol 2,3-dioxygenase-like lactoylglutathione lyase family enzyme